MADTPTTNIPTLVPPAANASFWQYLKGNIPNHLKVIGIVAGVILSIIAVNYVRDLRRELQDQQKKTATLEQKYQQIGTTATVVTGNSQAPQQQVTQQAGDIFGPEVLKYMAQQGAQINSLSAAVGLLNSQVTSLGHQNQVFTPQQQNTTTGTLSGYSLEENRKSGPALSSVNLFYDPAQRDPNKAFAGTTWTHYQEQFNTSIGNWERQKDGGLRTTVKLSRTVSKPDPTDPTKMIAVGTEDIPLTSADTVYAPKGLLGGEQPVPSRWTIGLGLSSNKVNSYTLAGHVDYRLFGRFGVYAGTANNGLMGGVSIRLDKK